MNVLDSQSQISKRITWNDNFTVGIKLIDDQHKELVNITNELYDACLKGGDEAAACFKKTIRMMVNHAKEVFTYEEDLFQQTSYPAMAQHKAQHREFIKTILEHEKKFQSGVRFAPNSFVRYLMDWISSHIAVSDKNFGIYYAEQSSEMIISFQQAKKLLIGVKKFRLFAFSMLLTHLKEIYLTDSSEDTVKKCVEVINAFLVKNRKIMAADFVIIKSL